jgi:hypothetical protein
VVMQSRSSECGGGYHRGGEQWHEGQLRFDFDLEQRQERLRFDLDLLGGEQRPQALSSLPRLQVPRALFSFPIYRYDVDNLPHCLLQTLAQGRCEVVTGIGRREVVMHR